MDNIHETNYSEKLLSNYHPNDNPSYPVPVLDSRGHEHHPPPRRHVPPSMCQRVTARIFKITLSIMIVLLMLLVSSHVGYDMYSGCLENMEDSTGMKHDGGKPWHHHHSHHSPGHSPEHPPHHPPKNSDCRKTGCGDGSACVKLNAHITCFTEPCPPELFLCLPLATPDDSKNATPPSHGTDGSHADGTSGHPPDASSPGRKNKITEAFFTCLKAHNGNVVWNHPVETCNTCRCLPGGGVSCTKKLCSTVTNNAASEGAENSKAPMAEIAV